MIKKLYKTDRPIVEKLADLTLISTLAITLPKDEIELFNITDRCLVHFHIRQHKAKTETMLHKVEGFATNFVTRVYKRANGKLEVVLPVLVTKWHDFNVGDMLDLSIEEVKKLCETDAKWLEKLFEDNTCTLKEKSNSQSKRL